ncbi:MAG: membrane protein insertion efficiency factor YidD [Candidatus Omnitrophota bacterium]
MRKLLVFALRMYHKYISINMLTSCRFHPTCSEYAAEAIDKRGIFIGIFYSIKRLLRCNPFSKGGYDPLPPLSNPGEANR